jgi:hypothetical protein
LRGAAPQQLLSTVLVGRALAARCATLQVVLDALPFRRLELIVEVGRKRFRDRATLAHAVALVFRN